MKWTRTDKVLGLLILTLFIIGGYIDEAPPSDSQKPTAKAQAIFPTVRYEFTTVPFYRVEEPTVLPQAKKKSIKKRSVVKESFTTEVTAYCPCSACCGKWAGGKQMKVGEVAASRSLPFGTRLRIAGKTYTVKDRLSKKYDHRVDIYYSTHAAALNAGKKIMKVEVLR